jgi:hypothetical protein
MLVASQRPHIAAAWLVAIAAGTTVHTKRIGLLFATTVAAIASIGLLSYLTPDLFNASVADGVSTTLSERYASLSARDGLNGEALTGANPIPVLSGLLLILFRPWPFEVKESHAFFVGLEVWFLALIGLSVWWSAKRRWQLLLHSAMISQMLALAALGYYFSYMYNMGLVARQRLMCLPAVLFIYFFPLLANQNAWVRVVRRRAARRPSPLHGMATFSKPSFSAGAAPGAGRGYSPCDISTGT